MGQHAANLELPAVRTQQSRTVRLQFATRLRWGGSGSRDHSVGAAHICWLSCAAAEDLHFLVHSDSASLLGHCLKPRETECPETLGPLGLTRPAAYPDAYNQAFLIDGRQR